MGSANLVPVPSPDDKHGIVRAIRKLASLRLNADSTPTFAELTLSGELNATGIGTGYIDFDITATPGEGPEGRMKWNATQHTAELTTGLGPVLQIGKEIYIDVYNNTASPILNGTAVYPVGAVAGFPSVEEADAEYHTTFRGDVLVTTMDIPAGTMGIATKLGEVHGLDTSGLSGPVYLAPAGTGILNNITNVKPSFPHYVIQLGGVSKIDPTDGVLLVQKVGIAADTTQNFWNGTFRETFDFLITSAGGVVTGSLSPANGHDDMTMMFSDGFSILTTTPAATIVLTAGTDSAPQRNFVYIPKSTKVLAVSTSDFPVDVEHIKVAIVVLRSAVATETEGAFGNQNYNDHIQSTVTNQGHLSHIGERIRQDSAKWYSGAEGSVSINAVPDPDEVTVAVTEGKIYQLHRQTFPAADMAVSSDIHVVNNLANPYVAVTDLNTQILDALGGSLTNRSFSFVVWGAINKTGEESHIFCNLPVGSYNSASSAIADALNYSVYTIPNLFKSTGFLIGRYTFSLSASGGGSWTLEDSADLRGFIPNLTAGGGAGGSGVTTFLGLTDTPSAYSGQALKVPQVNAGETALEFVSLVIDHGGLTGLADDDHTQYHTDARAATWLAANHETTFTHADISLNTTHRGLTSGNPHIVTPAELSLVIGTDVQAHDGGLDSLAGLTFVSASFVKMTAADTYSLRTIAQTASDLEASIDHDALLNFIANKHIDWTNATSSILTTGTAKIGGATDTEQLIIKLNASQSNSNPAIQVVDSSDVPLFCMSSDHVTNMYIGNNTGLVNGTPSEVTPVSVWNTYIGGDAGKANTTGYGNTGIGYRALTSLTSGFKNMAFGYQALQSATTADQNVAIGFNALSDVVSTADNVGIGASALTTCTGSNNIAIGFTAGLSISSGSSNTIIGRGACSQIVRNWAGNSNVVRDYGWKCFRNGQ